MERIAALVTELSARGPVFVAGDLNDHKLLVNDFRFADATSRR